VEERVWPTTVWPVTTGRVVMVGVRVPAQLVPAERPSRRAARRRRRWHLFMPTPSGAARGDPILLLHEPAQKNPGRGGTYPRMEDPPEPEGAAEGPYREEPAIVRPAGGRSS